MDTDTGTGGSITDRTEGGDPNCGARFEAELRKQLDEGGMLFGYGADGAYWAVTRDGRRRVVPGTGGQVPATDA